MAHLKMLLCFILAVSTAAAYDDQRHSNNVDQLARPIVTRALPYQGSNGRLEDANERHEQSSHHSREEFRSNERFAPENEKSETFFPQNFDSVNENHQDRSVFFRNRLQVGQKDRSFGQPREFPSRQAEHNSNSFNKFNDQNQFQQQENGFDLRAEQEQFTEQDGRSTLTEQGPLNPRHSHPRRPGFKQNTSQQRNGRRFSVQSLRNQNETNKRVRCGFGESRDQNGRCVKTNITKKIYVYENPEHQRVQVGSQTESSQHYNLIFIKNPTDGATTANNKKKTIVYVLNKQLDDSNSDNNTLGHEVYYVNYKDGDNPLLPHGVELETVLQNTTPESQGGFSNFRENNDDSGINGDFGEISVAKNNQNSFFSDDSQERLQNDEFFDQRHQESSEAGGFNNQNVGVNNFGTPSVNNFFVGEESLPFQNKNDQLGNNFENTFQSSFINGNSEALEWHGETRFGSFELNKFDELRGDSNEFESQNRIISPDYQNNIREGNGQFPNDAHFNGFDEEAIPFENNDNFPFDSRKSEFENSEGSIGRTYDGINEDENNQHFALNNY